MYQQQKQQPSFIGDSLAKSRIDMLIAIYDAAITATENLAADLSDGGNGAVAKIQLLKAINLIESGLDLSQGELPRMLQQICHYIEHTLHHGNEAEVSVVYNILTQLRDAYVQIQPEARKLEEEGVIPPLPTKSIDAVA